MKRNKRFKTGFGLVMAILLIALTPQALTAKTDASKSASTTQSYSQLSKQVRKRLVSLPYYGVFDNLAYSIDGSRVTLHGEVVRPSTRSDAERSVRRIEGVSQVINNIRVLPLSSFDDSIRASTYRALNRTGGLYRYFMGANPSVHIIVDRGNVTLTGMVGSKMDRQLAYMAARGVSGAFSVTNKIQVEGENEAW